MTPKVPKMKKLHHRWLSATPGTILSFGAVLSLFFVITGVPLNSKIYFLEVVWNSKFTGTGSTQVYTIGLWGWCFGLGSDAGCSVPDVGFELGDNADYFNFSPPHTTLGYLTVAHLAAFIMAIIVTFMGGFAHCDANKNSSLLTWTAILSIFTLLVTLFSLIVDTILYKPRTTRAYVSKSGPAFAPMGVSVALLSCAIVTFLVGQRVRNQRLKEKECNKNAKTNDDEEDQQMDDRPTYSNTFQRDEEEEVQDNTWSGPEIPAPMQYSNPYPKYPGGRPLPSLPNEDKSMLTIPPYRSLAPFAPPPPSPNSGISSFDNLLERHSNLRSSSLLSSEEQPVVQTTKSNTKKSYSTHNVPSPPRYPLASDQPVVQTTAKKSYSTHNEPRNPHYRQPLLTSRFTLPTKSFYNYNGSNLNNDNNNNNSNVDDVESVIDYYQNGSSPEGGFRRWV